GCFDHRTGLIGFEQFVQLVLRQGRLNPFGPASETVTKPSHSRRQILRLPGETRVAPPCIPCHPKKRFSARASESVRTQSTTRGRSRKLALQDLLRERVG